jgi:radical SAM enzyme (TIGR01210 family)
MPEKGELRQKIMDIRRKALLEREEIRSSHWKRRDRMFHGVGTVHYAILDTGGCRWALNSGGCSMCGFANDSCCREVLPGEIKKQVEGLMTKITGSGEPLGLRVFTSGSFLDDSEIDPDTRDRILCRISKLPGLSEFTVESRPEHVTEEKIGHLTETMSNIATEVAIGLESSSDDVRENCIGKGFSFGDFQRAGQIIRDGGSRCKAYILLKPPFLSEYDAAYDSIQSMLDSTDLVDSFSLNACNVQKGTLVEELHRSRSYRPPWIWTVRQVLLDAHREMGGDIDIICDTVAYGTRRGPHNCRRCDKKARATINSFSLNQDPNVLDSIKCKCRGDWEREFYYHY